LIQSSGGPHSYRPRPAGEVPIQGVPPAERTLPTCISVNARAQAADVTSRAPIVKQAVDAGQIAVVAFYEIKTGKVSLI
jgi:hypothetical protein